MKIVRAYLFVREDLDSKVRGNGRIALASERKTRKQSMMVIAMLYKTQSVT